MPSLIAEAPKRKPSIDFHLKMGGHGHTPFAKPSDKTSALFAPTTPPHSEYNAENPEQNKDTTIE